jgi:diguanylate cyclase (GGDEF)-like protein
VAPGGKARILIIDDEPEVRNVLRELLRFDYDCREADSAERALELLVAGRFDLVISDINMRGISGLDMIPQVLRRSPDTVVVMISGENSIESAIAAMRAGAYDYVTKPFALQHVEAAVERALKHCYLLKEQRHYEDYLEEVVKQRTAELEHLVYHDPLTQLPNRVLFEDRLNQALAAAERNAQPLAVLLLSVDRFKKVNDSLGHATGDRLLCALAGRIANCFPASETVARFEGDEFAVLLPHVRGTEEIARATAQIQRCLALPFTLGGHELFITLSIGVSLFPHDGDNVETLLKNSGAALYRAKEAGGNNCQFYTSDMNAKALKRLRLESSLRRALEREEFIVYYQPKVETDSLKIVGMEALVRWQHPELGLVSPSEFIPVAEDTGLIEPLGEWVLRTACAQNKTWQDAGLPPLRVAVNISGRQFQRHDLLATIRRTLDETRLPAHQLELELTESSIMKNHEQAIRTLGELKAMGVRISIDDFGTGYSSMQYLKRLPIDVLKIDRSFVQDATTDPDSAALIMGIIALAHNLRLKVVAEGVETEEQRRFLHLLRCDKMQGYLFSKPLPPEAFAELILKEAVRPKCISEYAHS